MLLLVRVNQYIGISFNNHGSTIVMVVDTDFERKRILDLFDSSLIEMSILRFCGLRSLSSMPHSHTLRLLVFFPAVDISDTSY